MRWRIWLRGLRENWRIWLLGLRECKSDLTTHFGGDHIETYDSGRDFGRWLLGLD